MATLTIRKLDDEVYERLRARANDNGRSIEAEVRQILGVELGRRTKDEIAADMRAFHEKMVAKNGYLPDSTPLIRAIRDEE